MMAEVDPFARQSGESFVDYLARIKQLRGGMLLGQYTPTVDDVVAQEITTQPLGVEVVREAADNGGDDNERPMTEAEQEALRQGKIERAVGMLTGEANPMAQNLGLLGIPGVAVGALADYDANRTLDKQLESLGYTPKQVEAIRANPELLSQQLTDQNLGFTSTGYKPNLFDKLPSVTSIFSDIFGSDEPMRNNGGSGVLSSGFAPNVPGITSMQNLTPVPQSYIAPTTMGMLSTSLVNQNLSAPDYGSGWESGTGAFGGADDTTVSTGGDTSFDTTTFDDIANDSSWGGGDNDNSPSSSSSSDVSAGGGRASGGYTGQGGW